MIDLRVYASVTSNFIPFGAKVKKHLAVPSSDMVKLKYMHRFEFTVLSVEFLRDCPMQFLLPMTKGMNESFSCLVAGRTQRDGMNE